MGVEHLDLSTGRVVNHHAGAALAVVPVALETPGRVTIEGISMEGSLDNRVFGKDGQATSIQPRYPMAGIWIRFFNQDSDPLKILYHPHLLESDDVEAIVAN